SENLRETSIFGHNRPRGRTERSNRGDTNLEIRHTARTQPIIRIRVKRVFPSGTVDGLIGRKQPRLLVHLCCLASDPPQQEGSDRLYANAARLPLLILAWMSLFRTPFR